MWIFFYPLTTQQDKALERQPLDRVTQFLQMEMLMPKNWNCLVPRAEEKTLCRTKKHVSSIQRLGHSDTRHTTVALLRLAPRGKHSHLLPEQPGWSQSSYFPTRQITLFFSLLCGFDFNVFWALFFFPIQNNMVGRAKYPIGKTVHPNKGDNLWLSLLLLNRTRTEGKAMC